MPDAGRVTWQPNTSVGYLDQYAEIEKDMTMQSFLKSAFSSLYQLEREMAMAYEKAAMGDMEYLSLAAKHQEQLEIHDFYSIDTQIEQVANGLGLLFRHPLAILDFLPAIFLRINSSVFLISFCWAEY